MAAENARFQGTIPETYHRHLGPVIFEPHAENLAPRVSVQADASVLEIACGTGILTRRLLASLPPTTRIVASDLNQPMIDFARSEIGIEDRIEWRQADASALPFPDCSFAAVVCQFGLMFIPDKAVAVREARRVLIDGGQLVFNVWDRMEENRFGRIALETISGFFPIDPPTFFQIPFSCHDRDALRKLLVTNGFGRVEIETVSLEARCSNVRSFAMGLVNGNPVSITIQERGMDPEPIIDAVAAALARAGGDHPFRLPMQAIAVTARAE